MNLSELRLAILSQALDVYLEKAYGTASPARERPDGTLPEDASPEQVLELFQKSVVEVDGNACASYAMRLGNRNYPFMKLVLQEHIVHGEFFFGVDTHDDMTIDPDYPDYDAWMTVREFNRGLKHEIETGFAAIGLPTSATIRDICERRASSAEGDSAGTAVGSILVVDDEEDLAVAVECLLKSRGYEVQLAEDGRQAVERATAWQPDLVVLDYEMPEMDGLEVLTALRADPRTESIPVLLCTASKIGYSDVRRADGFLAKPFQESLLYDMVERLLDDGSAEGSPSEVRGGESGTPPPADA
ncbi:MAG: response regulator [Planctomycetota bacterium]